MYIKELIELDLSRNDLKSFEFIREYSLDNLERNDLSHNQLSVLPKFHNHNAFKMLRAIYSFNRIGSIRRGDFPDVSRLQLIDLEFNEIKEIDLDSLIVPTLYTLNLCHNRLTHINKHYFEHLFGLETLNLSNNLIEIIDGNSFIELSKLITLDLGNNSLYLLNGADFANLTSLRFLFLDRMPQLKLEETSFSFIRRNIKDIHLDRRLFMNESVVCLVNRTLTARKADRRRYFDIIYLLIANDLYDFDTKQRFCDISYFFLLNKISFNIKTDYSFNLFFKKCKDLLRPIRYLNIHC